jgi:adenylate cyclase
MDFWPERGDVAIIGAGLFIIPGTISPMPCILIVDDEPLQRVLIQECLATETAYNFIEAENGRQALELIKASPPDLIILDLMMPDLDGTQLCHLLKADPALQTIRVIMITAGQNDGVVREAGCDDYLFKPFEELELHAKVQNALRMRTGS